MPFANPPLLFAPMPIKYTYIRMARTDGQIYNRICGVRVQNGQYIYVCRYAVFTECLLRLRAAQDAIIISDCYVVGVLI